MAYIEVAFQVPDPMIREILCAHLADHDFEGFEEDGNGLSAYIQRSKFDRAAFRQFFDGTELFNGITYEIQEIEAKNWNHIWESGFEPVMFDQRLGIRASFHEPLHTSIELIIDPKMSFGTGHHATTVMMMQLMLDLDLTGKDVLDVGAGSGILSVLAGKLNAGSVVAIDNDPNAVENCIENATNNGIGSIRAILADSVDQIEERFDLILMNINKNTIVGFAGVISTLMKPAGYLLISGFLKQDLEELMNVFDQEKLIYCTYIQNEGWIAAKFRKN